MNMPGLSAEASLYRTSGRYFSDASWSGAAGTMPHLSRQASLEPSLNKLGIVCNGSCPPHCHVSCKPCASDPTVPTGCSRQCVSTCSDGTTTDFTSECPATSCCTQPPTCQPCTGQSCGGTFPNCSAVTGTGTQSCTACGVPFTRSC